MPFSGLLFICLLFSPKRVFAADKHTCKESKEGLC